ncbi:MAG: tetratricopeptide repeat protein [Planctomycetota bacterium]|nr:tetratricopeptide repeat protein [Planctomycetota bacterium]
MNNLNKPVIQFFILLLAGFVLYAPAMDGQWVFDDERLVTGHEWLWRDWEGPSEELQSWRDILVSGPRIGDEVRTGFRPVRFISYRLDVLILRSMGISDPEDPKATIPFHIHNLLLHVGCAFLLCMMIRKWWPGEGAIVSLGVSLVFLTHPVQSEAVAWISGRRDVLFAFFYLSALLLAVYSRNYGGWARGICIALLAALAMSAKEMAATLPLCLFLFSCVHRNPVDQDEREKLSFSLSNGWHSYRIWLPSLLVVLALAWDLLSQHHPGAGTEYWGGSLWATLWTLGRVLSRYVLLVFFPFNLTVDYSYAAIVPSSGPFDPWTSILGWIFVLYLLHRAWRKRREFSSVLSWPLFFLLLSPVLQIIPHPERFAERFLYLPLMAPLFLLASLLVTAERKYPGWRSLILPLVLIVFSVMTQSRLQDWQGPYELWTSATEKQPNCARAWFGLADAARDKGWNRVAIDGLTRSIDLLEPVQRDALQQGTYLQSLQIRAGLNAAASHLEGAKLDLLQLVKEDDTDGSPVAEQSLPWFELMKVHIRLSEDEAARDTANRLVDLESTLPEQELEALLLLSAIADKESFSGYIEKARTVAVNLGGNAPSRVSYQEGMSLLQWEQFESALKCFQIALRTIEDGGRASTARYRQAECLLKLGRPQDARKVLVELLEIDPEHLPSHLSLGELLLSSQDREQARFHFEKVLEKFPGNAQAIQGLRQMLVRDRIEQGGAEALPDPTRISTLTLLAEKLLDEGKEEKAREAFVEAEKQAEGPAELERRLDLLLRLARLDARRGEWKLSGENYSKLMDKVKLEARSEFILEATEVLRRQQGPETAFLFLERQETEGVKHPSMFVQLGALADQAGMPDEARQWYQRHLDESGDADEDRKRRLRDRINELKGLENAGDQGDS